MFWKGFFIESTAYMIYRLVYSSTNIDGQAWILKYQSGR